MGLYRLNHKTGEIKYYTTPNQRMIPTVMSYDVANGGNDIVAYTSYMNIDTYEYCSEVYCTHDGGRSWELVYDFKDHNNVHCGEVAMKPDSCLIAAGNKVYVSTDGGTSWSERSSGLGNDAIKAIASSPLDGNSLMAVTETGAYVSSDGGMSWEKSALSSGGLDNPAFSPAAQNVMAVGLHFSADNGATWRTISSKELHYAHAHDMAFGFAADGQQMTCHIASPDMGRLSYDIQLEAPDIIGSFPWTESFE